MSIKNPGNINWYVDTSFAVQKYMGSHNGVFMNMVTGEAYLKSSKHNMNTKSSNEAELVRVYDVLTQVTWTR